MAKDEDAIHDYLHIISGDCEICLSYRINQISDHFISPKIRVLKSKILEQGFYSIFPPLADEFISRHNVCAILNWYHAQTSDLKPQKMMIESNPLHGIDFKSGMIKFINAGFKDLQEEMLRVSFVQNYILDVRWYGTENTFVILIIKDGNWGTSYLKSHTSWGHLREAVVNAIDRIEILNIVSSI